MSRGSCDRKGVKPDRTGAATGGRDTGTADICREQCNMRGRGCEKSAHYHCRSELIDVSDRIKIALCRPNSDKKLTDRLPGDGERLHVKFCSVWQVRQLVCTGYVTAERCGRIGDTPASYSGGHGFKTRP
jgi:hypothetical protein